MRERTACIGEWDRRTRPTGACGATEDSGRISVSEDACCLPGGRQLHRPAVGWPARAGRWPARCRCASCPQRVVHLPPHPAHKARAPTTDLHSASAASPFCSTRAPSARPTRLQQPHAALQLANRSHARGLPHCPGAPPCRHPAAARRPGCCCCRRSRRWRTCVAASPPSRASFHPHSCRPGACYHGLAASPGNQVCCRPHRRLCPLVS